jgi:HPt (histidine-containing phosphotransfer) domain-containing protein
MEGNLELARELLDDFLQDTPERLRDMDEALKNRNIDQVQSQAHAVKGACLVLGAPAMADAAHEIERVALTAAPEILTAIVRELNVQLEMLKAEIQAKQLEP